MKNSRNFIPEFNQNSHQKLKERVLSQIHPGIHFDITSGIFQMFFREYILGSSPGIESRIPPRILSGFFFSYVPYEIYSEISSRIHDLSRYPFRNNQESPPGNVINSFGFSSRNRTGYSFRNPYQEFFQGCLQESLRQTLQEFHDFLRKFLNEYFLEFFQESLQKVFMIQEYLQELLQ